MANLVLYKDFYCINHTAFNSADTYTLINPVGISADTFVENSNVLIENVSIQNESTGRYFVNLNPNLYSFDNVYELVWSVIYDVSSPVKKLKTRFRLNPYNINASLDIEILSLSYGMDIEILSPSYGMDIEILGKL